MQGEECTAGTGTEGAAGAGNAGALSCNGGGETKSAELVAMGGADPLYNSAIFLDACRAW